MTIEKINTTRDEQVLLQAYFFNKNCSIDFYNQDNYPTERTRNALVSLIEKGVLSYKRNKKHEVFNAEKGMKEVEHGEKVTEKDSFSMMEPAAGRKFVPVFN